MDKHDETYKLLIKAIDEKKPYDRKKYSDSYEEIKNRFGLGDDKDFIIRKLINLQKYCWESIERVQNFWMAYSEQFEGWVCHHRLETDLPEAVTSGTLQFFELYYDLPASHLLFLKKDIHNQLHTYVFKNKKKFKFTGEELRKAQDTHILDCLKKYFDNYEIVDKCILEKNNHVMSIFRLKHTKYNSTRFCLFDGDKHVSTSNRIKDIQETMDFIINPKGFDVLGVNTEDLF